MGILANFKLRTKILAGFSLVILMSVILGAVSLTQLGKIIAETDYLGNNALPSITNLAAMLDAVNVARRSELQVGLATSGDEFVKYQKRFDSMKVLAAERAGAYAKLSVEEDERKIWLPAKEAIDSYFQTAVKTFDLAREGKIQESVESERTFSKKPLDITLAKLTELIKLNGKQGAESTTHAEKVAGIAKIWTVSVLAASLLLGVGTALLIAGSICGPVRRLADEVDKVAQGDLNIHLVKDGNDEVGELTGAFLVMVDNLRSLIGKVADTATQVAAAAGQMNATAEQTATGAEEVAAQAGTVATAGEEMAATSEDIAQSCNRAAQASQNASNAAGSGASVVEQTIVVMGQIADQVRQSAETVERLGGRSDQIGAIIGTIEDIADQTNLLALNAAIEAARAGEQGRGFAVVADEVRALAERTTRATKEIGDMIKAIQTETRGAVAAMEEGVQQVEAGTGEASRSGVALKEIMNQVAAVSMQVSQIATAAEEQTATSSEISGNMMRITEVVQHTAQGAQESASAASQLTRHADELQRLVRQFKLS